MSAGAGPSLICIGNVTVDEAVQPNGTSSIAAGGDAVFAALAARLYLDDVTILAPVGNDLPDELTDAITLAGTDPATLPRRDLRTVRNVVSYAEDGSRSWTLVAGDAHFDAMSVYPADVPARALTADGILVSAMSLESQLELLPWLREKTKATIYLDLQEDYLDGHRGDLLEMVALCDVFLPSEVEAVALADTKDLGAAARFFRDLGPGTVAIKRAERGSVVLGGDARAAVEVPVMATTPVDSTGAGDAFCGGFAAAHLKAQRFSTSRATDLAISAAHAGSEAARLAIAGNGIHGLVAATLRSTVTTKAVR